MHRWQKRREGFRAILEGGACIHPASVHDPVSVRIAESLGFRLGMYAGSVASMTVLGAPDIIVLTLSEFAEQAHRISRAADLPVLGDADHGYGNALNVMRTVEELEFAGLAGLSVEDTVLPTAFGNAGKATLTSIDEGVGKMKAALEARRDPGLVIAGRTSAPALTEISDTIERVKAYSATGVDAIFLVGLKTWDDVEAAAAATDLPLIVGGTGPEVNDVSRLADCGVRVQLQGHQPFAAATQAIYDTMKALKDGTPPSQLQGLASRDTMQMVTRDADYADWSKRFNGQ